MIDWLIDTLVWTSMLMLLVLILRRPVAEKFGARIAYALWLLPAARFFMPTLTHTVEREVPMATIAAGPQADPVAAQFVAASMAESEAAVPLAQSGAGWLELLVVLWAFGAAATFAFHQWRYHRDSKAILRAGERIERVGGIDLVVSPAASGPMAFGLVHRVIVLPPCYAERTSDRELDLALEHELSHHRSGDLFARQAGLLLLSLHWFNPIAWKAYAAFHFDQEAACDARVLARRGAGARADYGRAIAKSAAPARMLFANARDTQLKRRLLMMKNEAHRPVGAVLIVAVAALLLPATASRAVAFVDVPAPPEAPKAPEAPTVMKAPMAPTPPRAPIAPKSVEAPPAPATPWAAAAASAQDREFKVKHKHHHKNYSQMSAEEREAFDEKMEDLREALAEMREERPEMERELRVELRRDMEEARSDHREAQAEIAEARADIEREIARIEANRDALEEAGEKPDMQISALRTAQATLANIDVDEIVEMALSSVDPDVILSSFDAAEQSLAAMLRDMEARRNR